MPLVLVFVTGVLGVMLAFLSWESCCKDHCIALVNMRQPTHSSSSMSIHTKNVGVVLLCLLYFGFLAILLLIEAIIWWFMLYAVFLIPCMVLYVIVAIRKQQYWQAEGQVEHAEAKADTES